MDLLILGGQNPSHRLWVRQVADSINDLFMSIEWLAYKQWDAPGTNFDINDETKRASEIAKTLNDYIVIAKSIGTVITVEAIAGHLLQPKFCMLLGVPTNLFKNNGNYLRHLHFLPKTTVVQNNKDPYGSYDDVRKLFTNFWSAEHVLVSSPGATHIYDNMTLIRNIAEQNASSLP